MSDEAKNDTGEDPKAAAEDETKADPKEQEAADKAVTDAIDARDKAVAGHTASLANLATFNQAIGEAQLKAAEVKAKAEAEAAAKEDAAAADAAAKRAKTPATLADVDAVAAQVADVRAALARNSIH